MAEIAFQKAKLVLETCCNKNCGITWGVTEGFYDQRQRDGQPFYCPNGHKQWYTNSDAKKLEALKQKLIEQQDNTDWYKRQYWHHKEVSEHRANQVRGHKAWSTRVKNAISRGECPCCGEPFEDLKDHMETKHPDFKTHEEV